MIEAYHKNACSDKDANEELHCVVMESANPSALFFRIEVFGECCGTLVGQ